MQFGTHVYETARYSVSNEITRRHMVQDSNLHSHSIILHFAQKQPNISQCAFKLNSISTYFWELQSTNQISILTVDCRILQNDANLQTYDECECSFLQGICTGSVC